MNIRESLRQIMAEPLAGDSVKLATVLSVTGDKCNVELLDTEIEITDVRLQAEDTNGVLLTPKVNSLVIVQRIADHDYMVIMYSAVDEIKFLDGSYGGLIKISDLVTKLNNLESKVNSIINTFNTHTHTGVTTGGGTSGTTATPVSGTLTPTQVSDIENDKITHGTV